jgi:hypothetical protein
MGLLVFRESLEMARSPHTGGARQNAAKLAGTAARLSGCGASPIFG